MSNKLAFIRKEKNEIPFEEKRFYIEPFEGYNSETTPTETLTHLDVELPSTVEGYELVDYLPAKLVFRKYAAVEPVDPDPNTPL